MNDAPRIAGQANELIGLLGSGRDRLLDQQVTTVCEGRLRDLEVTAGRHNDGDGLRILEQRIELLVRACIELRGDRRRSCVIDVVDSEEPDFGQLP
jgi:hypothetical protein